MADTEAPRTALTSQQQADLAAFFYHAGWRYPEHFRKIWAQAMLAGAVQAVVDGGPARDAAPDLPAAGRLQPASSGVTADGTRWTVYGR